MVRLSWTFLKKIPPNWSQMVHIMEGYEGVPGGNGHSGSGGVKCPRRRGLGKSLVIELADLVPVEVVHDCDHLRDDPGVALN